MTNGGILRRIAARPRDDAGVSIIEVLVAALVFMIISVGLAQALVTTIRLAGDQKHRITALSLATGEIDLVRAYTSVFDVTAKDTEVVPDADDGTTYTVHRETAWIDGNGNDVSCGDDSGESLMMLRVNVSVTWEGQAAGYAPVRTDTVLAPNGSLNDPEAAVLILAVKGADGFGVEGVDVALTPVGSVTGVVPTPSVTDEDGCSYAINIPKGSYRISLTKDGSYVDLDGNPEPIVLAGDDASAHTYKFEPGTTKSLTAFIAKGVQYRVVWASGDPALDADLNDPATPRPLVWTSAAPAITVIPRSSTDVDQVSFTSNPLRLYPDSAGYSIVYGSYAQPNQSGQGGCLAPDPEHWSGDAHHEDGAIETVAGASDAPADIHVGVGVVHVSLSATKLGNGTRTNGMPAQATSIRAVMLNAPGNGNPGCVVTANVTTTQLGMGDYDLVLPFGTWQLSVTPAQSGSWNCQGSYNNNGGRCNWVYSAAYGQVTDGTLFGNVVTLDPRRPR